MSIAIQNLLIKQEQQLFLRKEPISVLADLIDDEFIEIGSSAQIHDKAEVIRWLAAEDATEIQGINFKAKFLAQDIVLLNYQSLIKTSALDKPKQAQRSSIWRASGKKWRLVFHQSTVIPS